jgi:hypothetical protein
LLGHGARETVNIYGYTQVRVRVVWAHPRRDNRQKHVDFIASDILVVLSYMLPSRLLAFIERVKIALSVTIFADTLSSWSSLCGSGVHPLMWCSEVTVRKDEAFLRTSTEFFCGISFHGWVCPYIFARTASKRLVHSLRCFFPKKAGLCFFLL